MEDFQNAQKEEKIEEFIFEDKLKTTHLLESVKFIKEEES